MKPSNKDRMIQKLTNELTLLNRSKLCLSHAYEMLYFDLQLRDRVQTRIRIIGMHVENLEVQRAYLTVCKEFHKQPKEVMFVHDILNDATELYKLAHNIFDSRQPPFLEITDEVIDYIVYNSSKDQRYRFSRLRKIYNLHRPLL